MLSEEQKNKLMKLASDFDKKHRPLLGNKCHCGGDVVRKVTGWFNGRFFYDVPRCIKCNRTYLHACNTLTYGEKEFLEALSAPMTI